MKPVVRQMRGPGMNKGLKKPRHGHIKKPEPLKTPGRSGPQSSSRDLKDYSKGTSYLSKNLWR